MDLEDKREAAKTGRLLFVLQEPLYLLLPVLSPLGPRRLTSASDALTQTDSHALRLSGRFA